MIKIKIVTNGVVFTIDDEDYFVTFLDLKELIKKSGYKAFEVPVPDEYYEVKTWEELYKKLKEHPFEWEKPTSTAILYSQFPKEYFQLCPVCNGAGNKIIHLYDCSGDKPINKGTEKETCFTCRGEKIIHSQSGLPPSLHNKNPKT